MIERKTKRHVAVDTDGRLLMVNLTPADVSEAIINVAIGSLLLRRISH